MAGSWCGVRWRSHNDEQTQIMGEPLRSYKQVTDGHEQKRISGKVSGMWKMDWKGHENRSRKTH